MAIQYGPMNPYAGLADAVATGMQLGSMRDKKTNFNLPDPGEAESVDMNKFLAPEKSSLDAWEEYEKTNKGKDPKYNQNVANLNVDSPAIKAMIQSGKYTAKEAGDVVDKISRGDSNMGNYFQSAIDRVGETTVAGKALIKKKQEYLDAQKQATYGRIGQLEKYFEGTSRIKANPEGRYSKETVESFSKEPKYSKEYYQLLLSTGQADKVLGKRGSGGGSNQGTRKQYYDSIMKTFENNKWTDAESGALKEFGRYLLSKPAAPYTQIDADTWSQIAKKFKVDPNIVGATGNKDKFGIPE